MDHQCLCSLCTSSHFPLRGSKAIMGFKNASPCITLKRAVPQDVELNYKGCHFQIGFTQSRAVLMINLLYPMHIYILLKWKIPSWAQVCIFVELHLGLNSLLTAMYTFPVFVSHHCKRTSNTSVSQYQVSEDGLNQACVWPQDDMIFARGRLLIWNISKFERPQPYRAVQQQPSVQWCTVVSPQVSVVFLTFISRHRLSNVILLSSLSMSVSHYKTTSTSLICSTIIFNWNICFFPRLTDMLVALWGRKQ